MRTWYKLPNESATACVNIGGRVSCFTKADLEEGLRVLAEKPVFTAKRAFNGDYEFQKHADGQVYYRSKDRTSRWYPIGVEKFCSFNDSELEAVLAARRS